MAAAACVLPTALQAPSQGHIRSEAVGYLLVDVKKL